MRCSDLVALIILAVGSGLGASNAVGQDTAAVRVTEAGISFDFQDADLRFVITALAEAGGLNVVFSGLPQRAVTLRTNRPVSRSEVSGFLRSVAESNGLRITEEGGLLRIETAAQQTPQQVGAAGQTGPSDLRLFVYRLRHARAVRLAATIQALFGGGSGNGGASVPGLSRAGLSQDLRGQQVPGIRPGEQPEVRVDVRPVAGRSLPADVRGEIQIVPDELTNSLLVRSSETDWEVVRQAIEELDLRPLQVLIEVLIAEVRRTDDFNLGLSLEVPEQRDSETGIVAGGKLNGTTAGDLVLRIMELGPVSADVVLSAVSSRGSVSILSRPVILAQNNQEARILVGSERPFVQVFRALPTDAAVRDQVVQYRDVGTSLTIRPTINRDGYVSLELIQEVSTATNEIAFGAPVISTREASTHLLVKDKQTVVLGGLVDRQQDRTRSGIPLLKDLPVLGGLFGSTRRTDFQTELFLFLTPHVIQEDADAERVRQGIEEGAKLLRKRLPEQRSLIPPPPDTSRPPR